MRQRSAPSAAIRSALRRATALCTSGAIAGACSGGGSTEPPATAGATTYYLVAIDGASLPAVYGRRPDTTTRVFADTLVLTPRTAGEGTYTEIAHVGITVATAAEDRRRVALDPRRGYVVVRDSIELITVGGLSRGVQGSGDVLVLRNTVRAQLWTYQRRQ